MNNMYRTEKMPITSKIAYFFSKHLLLITIFFVFVVSIYLILIPFFNGSYYWSYANYGEESQKIIWHLNNSSGGISVLSGIILLIINGFLIYVKLNPK